MRALASFLVLCMGCGDPITAKGAGGDAGSNADSDGLPDWPDAGDESSPDADDPPEIGHAQAVCDDGDTSYWTFLAVATDDQGVHTLSPEATVEVLKGDESLGVHAITLDESSQYRASVEASEVGVSCSAASNHDFAFVVTDQDGNESEPRIVTGE